MAFQKGNPGKAKGTKHTKTKLVEETAKRLGCDPFEILCLFALGDWSTLGFDKAEKLTPYMQLQAAGDACKYLYATKKSVELKNPEGEVFKVEVCDYTDKK